MYQFKALDKFFNSSIDTNQRFALLLSIIRPKRTSNA